MSEQMSAAELIILCNDHFEEIFAVWEELATVDEGKTFRDAATEWLKRQKEAEK